MIVGKKEKWRGASRTDQARLSISAILHAAD